MSVAGTPADAVENEDAIRAVVTRLSRRWSRGRGRGRARRHPRRGRGLRGDHHVDPHPRRSARGDRASGVDAGSSRRALERRPRCSKAPAAALRPPGQRADLRPSRRKVAQAFAAKGHSAERVSTCRGDRSPAVPVACVGVNSTPMRPSSPRRLPDGLRDRSRSHGRVRSRQELTDPTVDLVRR